MVILRRSFNGVAIFCMAYICCARIFQAWRDKHNNDACTFDLEKRCENIFIHLQNSSPVLPLECNVNTVQLKRDLSRISRANLFDVQIVHFRNNRPRHVIKHRLRLKWFQIMEKHSAQFIYFRILSQAIFILPEVLRSRTVNEIIIFKLQKQIFSSPIRQVSSVMGL